WWPERATVEYFQKNHDGKLPPAGTAASVVPAALDAWLTALGQAGTMELEDVIAPARRYAADGVPGYEEFTEYHRGFGRAFFDDQPTTASVLAPGGRIPLPGELLRQPVLAGLLDALVAVAKKHRRSGRGTSIQAARDYFYTGAPARDIARYCAQSEG